MLANDGMQIYQADKYVCGRWQFIASELDALIGTLQTCLPAK